MSKKDLMDPSTGIDGINPHDVFYDDYPPSRSQLKPDKVHRMGGGVRSRSGERVRVCSRDPEDPKQLPPRLVR